ncbi:pyruvate carboxylase [compost metagenome]
MTLAARGRDQFAVHTGTAALPVVILDRFTDGARAEISGAQHEFRFLREGEQITLFLNGDTYVLRLPDALGSGHSSEVADDEVSAPMPGIVKLIRVRPGDTVEKGQALAVMEAMKMELTLSASRAGVVESVLVSEGEQVSAGAVLVMLQAESAE